MLRSVLWVIGGLLCAVGMFSLLFGFGATVDGKPVGDMATSLSAVGWDAVGDVAPQTSAPFAAICLALGLPVLVGLNATAWKKTGGY
jgi:hypothetical protein